MNSRLIDKGRRTPPNPWPSGAKSSKFQANNSQLDDDDNQTLAALLGDIMTSTSLTPYARHNETVRHPYAISLDRTKVIYSIQKVVFFHVLNLTDGKVCYT